MAKYCIEKFESDTGLEKKVWWRQDKHVHDAGFISTIKQRLATRFGGNWDVRVNSYESNQSSPPVGGVDYQEELA